MIGLQAGAAAAAVRGHLSTVQICSLARHSNALTRVFASVSTEADAESFAVTPGSLLHICCTDPQTHVHISNRSGQEDTVTLQASHVGPRQQHSSTKEHFLIQQLPGSRIIEVVQHAAGPSSSSSSSSRRHIHHQQQQQQQQSHLLSGTIPSRFCGLSVTTAGGSVTVGQLQEADMHISTSGGAVKAARCRAHNASINTAADQQQQQHGSMHEAAAGGSRGGRVQVDELSASCVSVYSGGSTVDIKRLFGLTVDVLSGGGHVDIGSVYADRAAISTAGDTASPAAAAASPAAAAAEVSSSAVGLRAAAAGCGVTCSSSSSGRLHVGHIACVKGEARLESGGSPLVVDGLEGNAALISRGGDVKVHLHEHAGLVYVDSAGGCVTAWLTPSGTPLGLQVKAAGGVSLDPALKVTGEVGPSMLFGVTSGDGSISSMSSKTSAMVQEAVAAAQGSGLANSTQQTASIISSSSSSTGRDGCSAEEARWKQNEQQVAAWSQAAQQQAQAAEDRVASGSEGGGSSSSSSRVSSPAATRQLIINAGWGRVELKAMGWMDGLKARMQAKQGVA